MHVHPHTRPLVPVWWGREQLLGYWVSCETVKGSVAPLIPRGRERLLCHFHSLYPTLPPSSYPPALVMTLLLSTEKQLDWLHRCMSLNTVLDTLTLRGGIKDNMCCSYGVVLSLLACEGWWFWWQHALLWDMVTTLLYISDMELFTIFDCNGIPVKNMENYFFKAEDNPSAFLWKKLY